MSIGSVRSVPPAYTPPITQVAAPPAASRDSDGDNDGSGKVAAAPSPASQGRVNILA